MRVHLNGEPREVPESMTVAELLSSFNLGAVRVAVEVNLAIVSRARYPEHRLAEGDLVEVVSFVGGG
jgi:sulfur carrier protein